jgi:hypothetical protein
MEQTGLLLCTNYRTRERTKRILHQRINMAYFKGTIKRGNFTPYRAEVLVMPAPAERAHRELLHHGPVQVLKFPPSGVRHPEREIGTLKQV